MKNLDKKRIVKLMETITQDMENDAKRFDGQPFNGKTVAEYFGNHGAAIAALADTIALLVNKNNQEENDG